MTELKTSEYGINIPDWKCDICDEVFHVTHLPTKMRSRTLAGHPEQICDNCYAEGLYWAIKKASTEKKRRLLD